MSRNLYEPTEYSYIAQNRFLTKDVRQKPLASSWIHPLDPGDCPPTDGGNDQFGNITEEWYPCLLNSWQQVQPPLEPFGFRLHYDGSLEFKGHLDSENATSGTIAFILPGATAGEPNYLPRGGDQFFLTVIYDGTSARTAMVYIDAGTGEVKITFPVT